MPADAEGIQRISHLQLPFIHPFTIRSFSSVIAPFKPSLLYLSNRRDCKHRAVASVSIEHRNALASMLPVPAACELPSSGHHPAVPAIEPSTYR